MFFCTFCRKEVKRFMEHMKNKHKHEEQVAEILSLPPNSDKRKAKIEKLKVQANEMNQKGFIAKRGVNSDPKKLKKCVQCNKLFVKKNFYLHKKR